MNGIPVMFGIGGARIRLSIRAVQVARGDILQGEVTIMGGKVAQRINTLKVSLVETIGDGGKNSQLKTCAHVIAGKNFWIQAGERQRAPFEFVIPDNARLSSYRDRWRVMAKAELAWALPQSAQAIFHVGIHREIVAIQRAFEALGFIPVLMPLSNPNSKSLVSVTHYTPPPYLREQIDRATLTLEPYGPVIVGILRLSLHEAGMVGRLKSLTVGNQQEISLQIPRANLISSVPGWIHPEGGRTALTQALAVSLVLPNNAEKWLLRGSSAPTDNATLLRAAGPTNAESASELLRADEGREAFRARDEA